MEQCVPHARREKADEKLIVQLVQNHFNRRQFLTVMRPFEMHLSRNNDEEMKVLTGENVYHGHRKARINFKKSFLLKHSLFHGFFLCYFSKFQNKMQWV